VLAQDQAPCRRVPEWWLESLGLELLGRHQRDQRQRELPGLRQEPAFQQQVRQAQEWRVHQMDQQPPGPVVQVRPEFRPPGPELREHQMDRWLQEPALPEFRRQEPVWRERRMDRWRRVRPEPAFRRPELASQARRKDQPRLVPQGALLEQESPEC
jgi:hypothetical protein